jgi:hypothetical protein
MGKDSISFYHMDKLHAVKSWHVCRVLESVCAKLQNLGGIQLSLMSMIVGFFRIISKKAERQFGVRTAALDQIRSSKAVLDLAVASKMDPLAPLSIPGGKTKNPTYSLESRKEQVNQIHFGIP